MTQETQKQMIASINQDVAPKVLEHKAKLEGMTGLNLPVSQVINALLRKALEVNTEGNDSDTE